MASSETSTRLRARRSRPKSTTLNNTTARIHTGAVARMVAKADGLVIERRERIGDIQPPQDGEGHPAAARFAGDGAHHRDAGDIEQNEDQVAVCRRRAAKFTAHHAHGAGGHLAIAFAGFDGVGGTLRLKVSFSPCHVSSTAASSSSPRLKVCGLNSSFWISSAV